MELQNGKVFIKKEIQLKFTKKCLIQTCLYLFPERILFAPNVFKHVIKMLIFHRILLIGKKNLATRIL